MVTTTIIKEVVFEARPKPGEVLLLRIRGRVGEKTIYFDGGPDGLWDLAEVIGYRDALNELILALTVESVE